MYPIKKQPRVWLSGKKDMDANRYPLRCVLATAEKDMAERLRCHGRLLESVAKVSFAAARVVPELVFTSVVLRGLRSKVCVTSAVCDQRSV